MTRRPYLAPIVCIALGMIVIAGSSVVPRLPKPDSSWTPEKAAEFQQTSEQLVELSKDPEIGPEDPHRQEVQARYEELRGELTEARGGLVAVGMILQMLGVGLGLVGAVWLIVRQNQVEDRAAEPAEPAADAAERG